MWLPWRSSGRKVQFRFEQKRTKLLGLTYRPMVDVAFRSQDSQDWMKIRMLVDTGADYTLVPRFWAGFLGISLADSPREETTGIGGVQSVSFVNDVEVKLGHLTRKIPVGFASSDKVPPLMGRHLFFETFTVGFEGKKRFWFKDL